MDFLSIWHALQEDLAWQQLYRNLRDARETYMDIQKNLKPIALTDYERDYIDFHIAELDEAINACNDYYCRFLAQHEKN